MFQLEFRLIVNGDDYSFLLDFDQWPSAEEVSKRLKGMPLEDSDPFLTRAYADYAREVLTHGMPEQPGEPGTGTFTSWGRIIRDLPMYWIRASRRP